MNSKLTWAEKGLRPGCQRAVVPRPVASLRPLLSLRYKTYLGAFLSTFISPEWVEGTSSGRGVKLLFLIAPGAMREGQVRQDGVFSPRLQRASKAPLPPASGDSYSCPRLTPLFRSAQLAFYSWILKHS